MLPAVFTHLRNPFLIHFHQTRHSQIRPQTHYFEYLKNKSPPTAQFSRVVTPPCSLRPTLPLTANNGWRTYQYSSPRRAEQQKETDVKVFIVYGDLKDIQDIKEKYLQIPTCICNFLPPPTALFPRVITIPVSPDQPFKLTANNDRRPYQ